MKTMLTRKLLFRDLHLSINQDLTRPDLQTSHTKTQDPRPSPPYTDMSVLICKLVNQLWVCKVLSCISANDVPVYAPF